MTDWPDSLPDVPLEYERDDGHQEDEEESDAVLDEEEGEVVGEVHLGHVHVHRVRRHEGQGEAHDDAPAGTLLPTETNIFTLSSRR